MQIYMNVQTEWKFGLLLQIMKIAKEQKGTS